MTKRLVDIDDEVLSAARMELGTDTIKDTVDQALRRVADSRRPAVRKALDALAKVSLEPRENAWR